MIWSTNKSNFNIFNNKQHEIQKLTQEANNAASSFSWKRDPGRTWHVNTLKDPIVCVNKSEEEIEKLGIVKWEMVVSSFYNVKGFD